jgi:hypothetical protein
MSLLAGVRDERGSGAAWPLFRVDQFGQISAFGDLITLDGPGSRLRPMPAVGWLRDEFSQGVFPGLPWFLDDQRPQGFLGRLLARSMSRELGFPSNIDLWSDYDVLIGALLLNGEHAPGNFTLGEGARVAVEAQGCTAIPVKSRDHRYAELALMALSGKVVGPWVGGEQPKFTTIVDDGEGNLRHVIVKFSEPVDNHPAARRWADLLICEHLAGELLAEQGNASSPNELIWSQGRLCLEVTRFDRVGAHGRRGTVTLAAWSDAHDGERDDWPSATQRMLTNGWVGGDVVAKVRERWWFGRLIGNTDMHFGNLSFFLDNALPLLLTPSYDMLPMLYRPASSGEVVARQFQVPVPTRAILPVWRTIAAWAETYWQRVAAHAEISHDFRMIAEANLRAVERMRARFSAGNTATAPL